MERQYELHTVSTSVALDILHAMRMRHIVVCDMFGSTIFFFTLSLKRRDFREVIEHKMCVLIFSTTFV